MKTYFEFDLTEYNSYRIQSKCSKALFPESENDLLEIYSKNDSKNFHILGNGNNVILSKSYYEEEFIIFNRCFNLVKITKNEIVAEAGTTLFELSNLALENSLSGFEIFFDIPSSVGGAIVMNAGASGEEIKDLVIKVRYLDTIANSLHEIKNTEIDFKYRSSLFQQKRNMILLKAWFSLELKSKDLIRSKMELSKKTRWAKHPRDYPNCGSVFKRPDGQYVGSLIEKIGLKGFRIGGAMVSNKHAGFIINYSNATGKDILELIAYIQYRIKEYFGIKLELEQQII